MIPLLIGVAARGLAGRAGAGMVGRSVAGTAAHGAASYGAGAIQRGHQNRQQAATQKQQDHGFTQWVKENPGEALASGTYAMMRGTSLGDRAASNTQSLLQSTQFH